MVADTDGNNHDHGLESHAGYWHCYRRTPLSEKVASAKLAKKLEEIERNQWLLDHKKMSKLSRKKAWTKEDYKVYLRTNSWRKRRDEAINRAGGRCEKCNSTRRLDVHHLTYERIGKEDPGDLQVLCRSCHKWTHGDHNGKTLRFAPRDENVIDTAREILKRATSSRRPS